MTEEEEFAARYAAEQQASIRGSGGALSEVGKGAGRGLLGIPNAILAAGDWLESKIPTPEWSKVADPGIRNLLTGVNQDLAATPQTNLERMLGTGAEIATGAAIPLGGPAVSMGKRALNIAAPAVGGVVGEQLGGEMGKTIGTLAGPLGQAGFARMLSPQGKGTVGVDVRALTEAGVRPTVGQTLGGTAQKFEGLPLVREFAAPGQVRANRQWNVATLNNALKPIGEKVKEAGFKGFQQADDFSQEAFNRALVGAKPLHWNPTFTRDVQAALADIPTQHARDKVEEIFLSANRMGFGDNPFWKQTKVPYGTAYVLDPSDYKRIDSALGQAYRDYSGKAFEDSDVIARGILDMQMTLRNQMAAQNPANAPLIQKANAAFSNLVRVQQAVVDAAKKEGVFTPSGLLQAVKKHDITKGKKGIAKELAPMEAEALQGIRVLGEPHGAHVPYSMLMGAMGASSMTPYTAPIAATMGGLFGMYNPATQAALPYLLTKRPEAIRRLGQGLYPTMGERFGMQGAIPGLFSGEQQ